MILSGLSLYMRVSVLLAFAMLRIPLLQQAHLIRRGANNTQAGLEGSYVWAYLPTLDNPSWLRAIHIYAFYELKFNLLLPLR